MAELNPDPIEELRRHRSEAHRASTYGALINELCANSGYTRERAAQAATAVLCLLQQRIEAGEARNMVAQLPARLQDLLAMCEQHVDMKPRKIHRREFITLVAQDLNVAPEEAEVIARNVLGTVRQHISDGEAEQVERELPEDMRDLWWRPF